MRKATQNIVGVISLGVLAASWSIGQAAESGLVVGAPTATEPAATAEPTASATSSQSSSAEQTAGAVNAQTPQTTSAP